MFIKNLFIPFLIFIAVFIFFNEGEAMGEKKDYKALIKEKYQSIDFSDGIDKEEAVIIAQNDMINAGGEDKVSLTNPEVGESGLVNGCWYVSFDAKFKVRRRGLKWYDIHIDKKTGEIKVRGWGPS